MNSILFKGFTWDDIHNYSIRWHASPVNASPSKPRGSISGLLLTAMLRKLRFLNVEKPPKPSSNIPSWKPCAPLLFGSKIPVCIYIPSKNVKIHWTILHQISIFTTIITFEFNTVNGLFKKYHWKEKKWRFLPCPPSTDLTPLGLLSAKARSSPRNTTNMNASADGVKDVGAALLRNPWIVTILQKNIRTDEKLKLFEIICMIMRYCSGYVSFSIYI